MVYSLTSVENTLLAELQALNRLLHNIFFSEKLFLEKYSFQLDEDFLSDKKFLQ